MRFLGSAHEIDTEFRRFVREGAMLDAAVAWASAGFPAANMLLARPDQIQRMTVGLHFYQTDPEFIRHFLDHGSVRFMWPPTEPLFHPKLYLLTEPDGTRHAIVGSANFTKAGFEKNTETALLVSGGDSGGEVVLQRIQESLGNMWDSAKPMTSDDLRVYETIRRRKLPLLKKLEDQFGRPRKQGTIGDGRVGPAASGILRQPWHEYVKQVRADQHFAARRHLLAAVRDWFHEFQRFEDMPLKSRKSIAGIETGTEPVDWLLFGSMKGAGNFKHLIIDEPEAVSTAIDLIPFRGPVLEQHYQTFVDGFRRAFAGKKGGGRTAIASATRLLAMKRPDYFVCLDSKNRAGLCRAFEIPQAMTLDDYWSSICERIYESVWWNSQPPTDPVERDIWLGRVAFLDSIYYVRDS